MAQGFSVQVWGTWSRWFKSSLPEKQAVSQTAGRLFFSLPDTEDTEDTEATDDTEGTTGH